MLNSYEHVLGSLGSYLDGSLAPADVARVEQHCAQCPDCRRALDEISQGRKVARAGLLKTADFDLASDERPGVARRAARIRRSLPIGLGVLAAAAVLLGGIHLYYLRLAPSPYDLRVLGQTEWVPGTTAALHLRVLRHDTGAAVRGVPVTVELAGARPGLFVRLAEADATTGGDGSASPRFLLPSWKDGDYPVRITAQTPGVSETITRTIALRSSWRVMLSTDKPVYQPGQVIRMRSLALRRPDLRPEAGHDLVFSVTDPKGNVIFRHKDVTSRFGIGSSACPLAGELIEGPYQVECRVGSATSRATVEVKAYVLPKFKVALDLDRPYYQPGQVLRGRVRADYFFGKPVAGGAVTIAIEATDVGPRTHRRLEATTDAEGTAAFECPLPEALVGREQDSGAARIAVTATVRDTAGQLNGRSVSCVVTASPIRIEVIPEAGTLVWGLPNTVFFLTSSPDGRAARTRLSVSGIERELRTDDLGVATLEFTPQADEVRWTVRATDDEGREGRRQVSLTCGMPSGDYLVRTDKAVYRGGETMRVHVLGGGVEPVFLDLIKDGQTVLTQSIALTQGRGDLGLDLPPDLSGTVVVCAYRYGPEGLPVRKTRVIYVRPAHGLVLRTTLDRDEYRPGDRAQLTIALTDDQGRPTPGAVSLAAVDEAVFGVLKQRPGLEQTFFTLEQELLQPVYEIHDWSPEESLQAPQSGRDRFEQALFARTAGTRDDDDDPSEMPWRDRREEGRAVGPLGNPPHTLAVASFPEKARAIASVRRQALSRIQAGWSWLAASIVFMLFVWAMLHVRQPRGCAISALSGGILITLGLFSSTFLDSVRMAEESTKTSMADMPWGVTEPVPGGEGGESSVRVRQWFPETLLWRPELITDDLGRARLDVDLADSITTWRLTAGAVSAGGQLGGSQTSIRVFQPFFVDLDLPVALTRGDEVAVPVVVSNYLDRAQTVALTLPEAPWFERLEDAGKTIELAPGEVRSTHYRIRVKTVGRHEFQVSARGGDVADAIRRPIEVVPDGRRVEQVASGSLQRPAEVSLSVPDHAIEGSVLALVKLYPSSFSQLVEGLDAIFQRPYGCFEQTSSTTYPNILALDYLRRTGQGMPAVEAKARQYIHLGYQRLLTFEVPGGGFDWFGQPPANRVLTAYGLMEFEDMARVHDVDPSLIGRTRLWLLDQQKADGSWDPEEHRLHDDPTGNGPSSRLSRLSTTAYIAWSVFSGHAADPKAAATREFLLSQEPATIDDPYVLALVGNAMQAIDPQGDAARPYLDRLDAGKRTTDDGKLVWWESPASRRTIFSGAGQSGAIEVTALTSSALIASGRNPETSRGALAWLIGQKDAAGTWHSTQATVLALKALLAGTGKPLGGDRPRRIAIARDGETVRDVEIPADQADVMKQLDLSTHFARGSHRLSLTETSGTDTGYQVVFRYHEPDAGGPPAQGPLSILLDYDRTTLAIDERVTASATVVNHGPDSAPMVILDLPIPAGFAPQAEDLASWVESGAVDKFQLTPRSVIVYLRGLEPEKPLTLRYRLRAVMSVTLTAPPARAYEYYNPARHGISPAARLTVLGRP